MTHEEKKIANCFVGCTCTSVDLEEVEDSASADCFVGCTCTSVDLEEEKKHTDQKTES